MLEAHLLAPTVIDKSVSIARLHGEACFDCGAVSKTLRAAGRVVLRGSARVWPIVTCGCGSEAVAVCAIPSAGTPAGSVISRPATPITTFHTA